MATQKKQKLSNFDFSVEGAHVALVTRAANGKETPLIVKKVTPVEKGEYFEGDDESEPTTEIKMSLTDFLRLHCYMYEDEAKLIVNSIMKSAESDPEKYADVLKQIPADLLPDASVRQAQTTQTPEVIKMSDKDNKTPEQLADAKHAEATVALEKKVDEQNLILKGMQDQLKKYEEAEEIRKAAKFGAMAMKYKSIGANDDTALVLTKMAEVEGFEAIVSLLDSAVETLEKADLLKPAGVEGETLVVKSIDELQTIAKGLMTASPELTIQKAMVLAARSNPHLVK